MHAFFSIKKIIYSFYLTDCIIRCKIFVAKSGKMHQIKKNSIKGLFMNKKLFVSFFCLLTMLVLAPVAFAEVTAARSAKLPDAEYDGGMSLKKALSLRKSTRDLASDPVSDQDLSNLLWAAFGINREDGKRTIPTGHNKQNVAVYIAHRGVVWIYDAKNHTIHKILEEDVSSQFNGAGLTLFFAAEEGPYANMHVGSMYQNVGLYCASAGLGNVVRARGVDFIQEKIAQFLPSNYTVRITQSIGAMK